MRRHVLGSGQSSRGGGSVIRASGEKLGVTEWEEGEVGYSSGEGKLRRALKGMQSIPFCGSGKSEGMTQPEWDGRLTRQEMSGQGRRHLGCR